jgi:hypothetical protein
MALNTAKLKKMKWVVSGGGVEKELPFEQAKAELLKRGFKDVGGEKVPIARASAQAPMSATDWDRDDFEPQVYGLVADPSGKIMFIDNTSGDYQLESKNNMNNKYKIIAKAMATGKLSEVEMPDSLNVRTINLRELKKIVREEFEKAKSVEDLKVKEVQFSDAELEKEIDWVKTLKLENFLK